MERPNLVVQILLARHEDSITIEDYALKCELTHWMHVDWMVAMTSKIACHYLLQRN